MEQLLQGVCTWTFVFEIKYWILCLVGCLIQSKRFFL